MDADGKELKGSCCTRENCNSSVTMETAEHSKVPMNCTAEVAVNESLQQRKDDGEDENVCLEKDSSHSSGEKAISTELQTTNLYTDHSAINILAEIPDQKDQRELSRYQTEHEDLKSNESATSPVSDTILNTNTVNENKTHHDTQDRPETNSEPKEGLEWQQHHNPQSEPQPEQYLEQHPDSEPEQCEESVEHTESPGQYHKTDETFNLGNDHDPDDSIENNCYPQPEGYFEDTMVLQPDENFEIELYTDPEPEANNHYIHEDIDHAYLSDDTVEEPETKDPGTIEESLLEHCIREEAISDMSNDSCHDIETDEIEDSLRLEIVAASLDSESDEKWRTIFSSSINKEDDDSYLDSLQLSAQELFVQRNDVTDFEEQDDNFQEVCFEVPQVEDVSEQPEDINSFPAPTQDINYNTISTQYMSKLSDDKNENNENPKDTTSQPLMNADQNKKLPKDFCVIQETKSDNVSTEHVDFQLACRQWREMEEQTKTKVVLPTTTRPSLHASHSFMYTPVRNIERSPKKIQDFESLNTSGDYLLTHFSPCSEDSGLDDCSYRSPTDDSETPIEREIRLSMEREEKFRREKDFSKMGKSTDCAPSRNMPRSASSPLTPSFVITSSKDSLNHEVLANNVFILDPNSECASTHNKDIVEPRPGEWHTDDRSSNLIILETTNLIIRSASEFSLNKACEQPQEKMFLNNPFFKLRSRSTMSFVDEEIKMVKQREDELKKERANLYSKDGFKSNHLDTLAFGTSADESLKCKSSPSSPLKTAYRMDRSALSCDHRYPEVYTGRRRKSAMALRWEAGEFTKND